MRFRPARRAKPAWAHLPSGGQPPVMVLLEAQPTVAETRRHLARRPGHQNVDRRVPAGTDVSIVGRLIRCIANARSVRRYRDEKKKAAAGAAA
jgi:hypothetical protein